MKKSFYIYNSGDLKRKDNTLQFTTYEGEKKDIPIERISDIYVMAEMSFNTAFINYISQYGIPIHFFNYYSYYNGSYYPRESLLAGQLIVKQVEHYTDYDKRVIIAKKIIEAAADNILIDFIDGEYDVLVTTTIIETGVDIPNVNTLFVDNADRMGLSQLYQLRGRVGRSNRIAYAYFMYQPNKVLTEVAEKRLEAIKDFTELGSGFKIAMRDLSIRGAGNLLGKQQHGFIDSVGYDLYTQMLNDAVDKKRGKEIKVKTDAELNLDLEAYLPADYITDPKQKVEIYKRIHQFENEDQYIEVQDDLIDRFGEYPIEVHNLLEVGLLKMYADAALVDSVSQNKKTIEIELSDKLNGKLDIKDVFKVLSVTKFSTTLGNKNQKIQIKLNIQPGMESNQILEELKKLLKELAKMVDVTIDKSA